MTITEFLEARIAEDEAEAREAITERAKATPNEGSDTGLQCWPDSPVPAVLVGPERVIAECAAKRKLIAISDEVESMDHQITQEWGGACEAIDGTADDMLRAMAAVYRDHPDYQQEWAQ